jgi:hypothetical protein
MLVSPELLPVIMPPQLIFRLPAISSFCDEEDVMFRSQPEPPPYRVSEPQRLVDLLSYCKERV